MLKQLLLVVLVLFVIAALTPAQTATFIALPSTFQARGVSHTGTFVVGAHWDGQKWRLAKWTAQTGVELLSNVPSAVHWGDNQLAMSIGVSADGNVIAGTARPSLADARPQGWVWTPANGLQFLGALVGASEVKSVINDVSADGSTAIGWSTTAGASVPARWTFQEGWRPLEDPESSSNGNSYGVNYDGSVIVGYCYRLGLQAPSFRWTRSDNTMRTLGNLGPDWTWDAKAYAVSRDGSIVSGWSFYHDGTTNYGAHPFRSIDGAQMTLLPNSGVGMVVDMNEDGTLMAGNQSINPSYPDRQPFLWDPGHGQRDFATLLVTEYGLGATINGWIIREITAMSGDGSTIIGRARTSNDEIVSFVFRFPGPPPPPPPPPSTIGGVTLMPSTVRGGDPVVCRVDLTEPAPATGVRVTMGQSQPLCILPSELLFSQGQQSKQFTIWTRRVSRSTNVTVTASHAGNVKSATLTIRK
jgi:uncharacterized membrane protein